MRSNQYVTIRGRLTGDAELKSASTGKNYIRVGVAVNDKVKGKKEEVTTYYNIVCFDKMAEIFSQLKKGDYIRTEGRLELSIYKDSKNEPQLDATIIADEIIRSEYISVSSKSKKTESKK